MQTNLTNPSRLRLAGTPPPFPPSMALWLILIGGEFKIKTDEDVRRGVAVRSTRVRIPLASVICHLHYRAQCQDQTPPLRLLN